MAEYLICKPRNWQKCGMVMGASENGRCLVKQGFIMPFRGEGFASFPAKIWGGGAITPLSPFGSDDPASTLVTSTPTSTELA